MKVTDKKEFFQGFKDSFPVFVGYFAVAITIGISAVNAGMDLFSSTLMSFLNLTSAGEAAAIQIIHDRGTIFEVALSQIAINLRYLLMATALAVKLEPNTGIGRRLLMSLGITDEIFALSATHSKELNSMYTFGGYCMALPGWVLGTIVGVLIGSYFPPRIIQALSIGIYVMFIAIIVPPAKTNRVYALIIVLSAVSSFLLFKFVPSMSLGIRVVVLTVVLSCLAGFFFPIKEKDNE